MNGPRVLGLEAVEVVAPECLLAASPPPAESSLVFCAGGEGDAAVEKTGMRLLDRGRGADGRRKRCVGTEVGLECGVADGDGEKDDDRDRGKRRAGDCSFLHDIQCCTRRFALQSSLCLNRGV